MMCCVFNNNVVACTAGLEPQRVMQAFGSGCVLACRCACLPLYHELLPHYENYYHSMVTHVHHVMTRRRGGSFVRCTLSYT